MQYIHKKEFKQSSLHKEDAKATEPAPKPRTPKKPTKIAAPTKPKRQTKHGGDRKSEAFKGNRHTGSLANEKSAFAEATAETTGKSRRSVEIAAARGEALGNDLQDIAGTSLDKG
ncbi:hypothetical protein AMST5_03608 [freshwater sediment metagenome]|uniref:Uncharacterized protein n=1 Tax=freshwater sediment metagenome TaxID=556182 RepID=A0AA48RER0_9ZZZZ